MNRKGRRGQKAEDRKALPGIMNPELREMMQRAVALHRDGQIDQAMADYEAVLVREPRHVDALQYLGIAKMQTGQSEDAVELLRKAVALHPGNSQTQYNLGLAMSAVGREAKALAAFRRAVAAAPNNFEARTALAGMLFDNFNELETAESHLRRAIRDNPNYAPAHNNLALILAARDRPDEAAAAASIAVGLAPKHVPALITLGSQMLEIGKLAEAERVLRDAVALAPNDAAAHINLAAALDFKGALGEAGAEFERALALEPRNTMALSGLAAVQSNQRLYDEASKLLERALDIEPDSAELHAALGTVLFRHKKWGEAITRFRTAWDVDPDNLTRAQAFVDSLSGATYLLANAQLWKDVERGLRIDGINHDQLGATACRLLRNSQQTMPIIKEVLDGEFSLTATDVQKGDKLAPLTIEFSIFLLRRVLIQDPTLELLFTAIRKELLNLAADGRLPERINQKTINFFCALAGQCYYNEYVYRQSSEEATKAAALETEIDDRLRQPDDSPPRAAIAVLACYRPLNEMAASELLANHELATRDDAFDNLITQQIRDPAAERKLIGDILELGESGNNASAKERRHNYDNYFPRWISATLHKPVALRTLIGDMFPLANLAGLNFSTKPDLLVVGCGAGAQTVTSASRFRAASLLAMDLSFSSLAYGKRKAYELGVDQIQWAHGDILALAGDARRFDMIECSDALHHMREPIKGLSILRDLLKPGGVMKIGLYSERARSGLTRMETKLVSDRDDPRDFIRDARHEIFALPDEAPLKYVLALRNFYALSDCRDLLFRTEKHGFDLPQISHFLEKLNLEFLGFEMGGRGATDRYLKRFPDDPAAVNLDYWHRFETDNPYIFPGRYQFWVRLRGTAAAA